MKKNKYLPVVFVFSIIANLGAAHAQTPFVTVWKTDNPGTSATNQITIPTSAGGRWTRRQSFAKRKVSHCKKPPILAGNGHGDGKIKGMLKKGGGCIGTGKVFTWGSAGKMLKLFDEVALVVIPAVKGQLLP